MSYTEATLSEIWENGIRKGTDIGREVEPPAIGEDVIEETWEVKNEFLQECWMAEEGSRQFTPFEFTAKELNEREDREDAWEYFEEGIAAGFEAGWEKKEVEITEEAAIERTKVLLDELYGSIEIAGSTYYASEILEGLSPEDLWQMALDWADSRNLKIKE